MLRHSKRITWHIVLMILIAFGTSYFFSPFNDVLEISIDFSFQAGVFSVMAAISALAFSLAQAHDQVLLRKKVRKIGSGMLSATLEILAMVGFVWALYYVSIFEKTPDLIRASFNSIAPLLYLLPFDGLIWLLIFSYQLYLCALEDREIIR